LVETSDRQFRLLLSVPAGGGGAASSVAGGQDPVYYAAPLVSRGAGVRLQSPSSSRPSTPFSIVDDHARPLTGTPFDHPSASSY